MRLGDFALKWSNFKNSFEKRLAKFHFKLKTVNASPTIIIRTRLFTQKHRRQTQVTTNCELFAFILSWKQTCSSSEGEALARKMSAVDFYKCLYVSLQRRKKFVISRIGLWTHDDQMIAEQVLYRKIYFAKSFYSFIFYLSQNSDFHKTRYCAINKVTNAKVALTCSSTSFSSFQENFQVASHEVSIFWEVIDQFAQKSF